MLARRMVRQGAFLFRWRGLLPWVMIGGLTAVQAIAEVGETPAHEAAAEVWGVLCFALSLGGLALRALVVGFVPAATSGRNTRTQVAESLNTTGAYSLVRHPLYVANFVVFLGFALFPGRWLPALAAIAVYWIYYERIMLAEEDFLLLRFGREYERWAERTPAVLPRLGGWRKPELPFSWRTVVRREYVGVATVGFVYVLLEFGGTYLGGGGWELDRFFLLAGAACAVVFVVGRLLKRHTHALEQTGR